MLALWRTDAAMSDSAKQEATRRRRLAQMIEHGERGALLPM
jgi:hypothetical protein